MTLPEQSDSRTWIITFSAEHHRQEISGPFAWDEKVMPVAEHKRLLTEWDLRQDRRLDELPTEQLRYLLNAIEVTLDERTSSS